MPAGAFNVSQLIRELGLQRVTGNEMRVLETIQPTMEVADLSAVTPPHQAPTSLFAATVSSTAATFGACGVQSLGAGGCFIDWITVNFGVGGVLMVIQTTDPGFTLAPVAPMATLSKDPGASLFFDESIALFAGGVRIPLSSGTQFWNWTTAPLFIPRGSFFLLQSSVATTGVFEVGIHARDVPASEFAPS